MNLALDQFYGEWDELDTAQLGDGKNILLVEDDPFWQRVIARNINRATDACNITYVTTADEAIQMLNMNHHFHLIIADQFLDGEKTGHDLWRECQSRGLTVPFLLTSGNSDFSDQVLKEDPVLFVSKPFVAAELRRNLSDLLHARSDGESLKAETSSKVPVLSAAGALFLILSVYTYSYISGLDNVIQDWPKIFYPTQPFLPMPEEILAPPPPKDLIEIDSRLYALRWKHG